MALGEELVEGGVLVGVETLEAEGSCGFGPEVVVGWWVVEVGSWGKGAYSYSS